METKIPEFEESEEAILSRKPELKDYYVSFCKFSSKMRFLAKEDVTVTPELKDSLSFLEWDVKPFEVISFSRLVFLASLVFFILLNIVIGVYFTPSTILLGVGLLVPFVFAYAVTDYPKTEARLLRVKELGRSPATLTNLVIFLKQNPNLERAFTFVSEYSHGRLASEIKKSLWDCLLGYKTNLKKQILLIAERWGSHLEELKRSLYLIVASVSEKNEIKRNQTLDRAIKVSLEGIQNKVEEYTNQLYLPTLFLFSFGTILPLVIISLLPIFSFLGNEFASPLQMFSLLGVSLLAIYVYSNRIIIKRPPSFSKTYSETKPIEWGMMKLNVGKKSFTVKALPYVILVAVAISFPGILYLLNEFQIVNFFPGIFLNVLKGFNTLTIIWGFGAAICLYAYGTSWHHKKSRDDIEALDNEMIDGIYQLASRVSEGRSPEETIKHLSKSMPDSHFGKIMSSTYKILRSRHTTLEDAFFNENYGSLKNIESENFKSMMRVFINSLKKGTSHSSQTLFTMSSHYEELKRMEDKMKGTLRNALSMMRTTASVFAPIVTGLVITLQQLIQEGLAGAKEGLSDIGHEFFSLSFLGSPGISVEVLQLITGVYMILLAWLLIRYVCLLEYGKDKVMMRYEIYRNLPFALIIFTITLVMTRLMLSV